MGALPPARIARKQRGPRGTATAGDRGCAASRWSTWAAIWATAGFSVFRGSSGERFDWSRARHRPAAETTREIPLGATRSGNGPQKERHTHRAVAGMVGKQTTP